MPDARGFARGTVLWCAGVDLRLTLLAVPPLIPSIHRALRLDESGIAALSNLPVLVMALASVFGSLLVSRLGPRRALGAGLFAIALPAALRGVGPSIPMLFTMTIVMGLGIAISQPTLAALSRAWFPGRVALATGIWANGLLIGEAIPASLTLPLVVPLLGGSWERALAVWSAFVVVTAFAVLLVPLGGNERPAPGSRWFPDLRDRRVWQIGVFQSSASLAYFGANTFIPDYLHATGQPHLVGPALSVLNVGQLPASLLVGLIPLRLLGRPVSSLFVAGLVLGALCAFIWGGATGELVASGLFGLCAAYVLTLSFAMPALLAAPEDVARVSGGTFALGYAIAFVTTLLAGASWDVTHVPAVAFAPILIAAVIVAIFGVILGKCVLAAKLPIL
ncbi:MAG TPA: MFS transporter [Candidatus Sulfotelmatobacter sp.]|nr:MFS transporter [Candidatus Sulfotelmatobacter sp.]